MTNTSKIFEQHTKTLFGNIPEDWQYVTFEDVLNGFSSGSTPSRNVPNYFQGDTLWITSGELDYNVIYDTKEKITQEAVRATNLKTLKPGTFLFAITGLEAAGTRGSCAIVGKEATTNQSCMALTPKKDIDINYFFYYYCHFGDHLAFRFCQGTKQQSYNGSIARKLPLILPPLSEQQKIAEVLGIWDKAISSTQKLLDKLQLRNKGLSQQLLTGKKRLKGFGGEWKEYKVADLFQLVNRHIQWDENHSYNLVSIRRRHGGLFFRGTFEAREIKVKKLKRIETNDFLISKRQVSHGAWAVVSNRYDSHLVSDEYDCLAIKNKEKLDSNFWTFYCQQPRLTHYAFLDSIGVHIEKLIFHYRQFKKRVVRIPELKEQVAITSVLTEAGKELLLYQQQLTYLKEQKKGLMQKLLTGEIRVNTNIQE